MTKSEKQWNRVLALQIELILSNKNKTSNVTWDAIEEILVDMANESNVGVTEPELIRHIFPLIMRDIEQGRGFGYFNSLRSIVESSYIGDLKPELEAIREKVIHKPKPGHPEKMKFSGNKSFRSFRKMFEKLSPEHQAFYGQAVEMLMKEMAYKLAKTSEKRKESSIDTE